MGRKLTRDEIIKIYQRFYSQIDPSRKLPVWWLLTAKERNRIYQEFDQNVTLEDRTLEQDGWERVEPGNVRFRPGDMIRIISDRRDGDYIYRGDWQGVVESHDGDDVTTESGRVFYIRNDYVVAQLYIKRKPVTHPDPDEHPVIKVLDAYWPDDIEDNEKPVVYVANKEDRYYEGFLNVTHEITNILDPREITHWETPTGWEERQ
ncbi:hypothetical protein QDX23_03420 [Auritidibacter ignavus]|uniref:hypothetical protein n=1 Tax=Auritidibacter ignavus TaxID=678932 RepID=UPI00244CEAA1|nr:hypothetical protein [Auritidibacter ignavus]WGH91429.1 hypothetical protein QDX23_03420 [Auritidibacter ignavus]